MVSLLVKPVMMEVCLFIPVFPNFFHSEESQAKKCRPKPKAPYNIQRNPFVVYFDQLSGAARTRKLVETLFSRFQPFLLISNLFQ